MEFEETPIPAGGGIQVSYGVMWLSEKSPLRSRELLTAPGQKPDRRATPCVAVAV